MGSRTSAIFQKLASRRSLLRPPLLSSVLLSGVSAAVLGGLLVLLTAMLTVLITEGRLRDPAMIEGLKGATAENAGLLTFVEATQSCPAGPWVEKLVLSLPGTHTNAGAVTLLSITLGILLALRWVVRSTIDLIADRHAEDGASRLREQLHRQAMRLESSRVGGGADRVQHLFTEACGNLERAVFEWNSGLLRGVSDLMVVLIFIVAMDWRVGLEAMIPVFLGCVVYRIESQRSDGSGRLLSEQVQRGLTQLAESLTRSRMVAAFGLEAYEQKRFRHHLGEYRQRCRHLGTQERRGERIRMLLVLFVILIPGWILARHVLSNPSLSAAGGITIAVSLAVFVASLRRLQSVQQASVSGSLAAQDIDQYLREVPRVGQIAGARFLEPMSRLIQFDQVTVDDGEGTPLLQNLDLKVPFGESLAVVSTDSRSAAVLAGLVPRFAESSTGQVLIDGTNIREVTLESLRAEAVLVGGEQQVFSATVMDNIRCDQADITPQQAVEAAKLVHADSLIRSFPRGYDTLIGEHGRLLEPGEQFRIALARAMVRNPALIIIEEPDAALDRETKALLDDAYDRIRRDRTVIFVPRRLSTVKKCDRVILLHEGRVAADGRHEELVRNSELYRHWEYARYNTFQRVGREEREPRR